MPIAAIDKKHKCYEKCTVRAHLVGSRNLRQCKTRNVKEKTVSYDNECAIAYLRDYDECQTCIMRQEMSQLIK